MKSKKDRNTMRKFKKELFNAVISLVLAILTICWAMLLLSAFFFKDAVLVIILIIAMLAVSWLRDRD